MTARCRWCGELIARSLAGSVWRARGLSFCMQAPDHEHLPDRRKLPLRSPESAANGLPGTR